MERKDVIAFIQAIQAMQPFVPPIMFVAVINSPVGNALIAIANGKPEEVKDGSPGG